MKGMGLFSGPSKAAESAPEESAETLAMKAFAKSLKGSDTAAQLEAFTELMACCSDEASEPEE